MKIKLLALATITALSASSVVQRSLCTGFVPKNDRYIPADSKSLARGGMTQEQFTSVLDRIQKIYGPIVQARGGVLEIKRLWDDGTVNASAERVGTNTYRLNMYGGMARHELMTADGFMLVACHEMGHHVGGKPKYTSFFGGETWASAEGQSDYFGTAKCMRRMFLDMTPEELNAFDSNNAIAIERCAAAFSTETEQTMCERNTLAGIVLGNVLSELSGTGTVALDTPTPAVHNGIYLKHPKAQCRLDTYFQGSLCNVDHNVDYSDKEFNTGACMTLSGHTEGIRPKCWFNPAKKPSRKVFNLSDIFNKGTESQVYY